MVRGNILLVTKNAFLRRGLIQALTTDTLSVAGQEPSPDAALLLLQSGRQPVDVVLIDADTSDGAETIKAIADLYPDLSIVIIRADLSQDAYRQAAEVKARALLPYSISAEALDLILQLVILGEDLFLATGEIPGALATEPPKQSEAASHLSPREAEILSFIKLGAPNKVIARELDVAEATVKVHVKSVLRKINVGNRTQAAIWAMDHADEGQPQAVGRRH